MPRVLIISDDGEVVWNEGVTACDFDGDHFRRCLVDRLGWAVADAESTWRLSTPRPIRVDKAAQRVRGHAAERQPVPA